MDTPQVLLSCEPVPYGISPVKFDSKGKEIFVISDLHIASGLKTDGNYNGTENFFADQSFTRFLNHIDSIHGDEKNILIINGDFIDFLRVREIPSTEDDFNLWHHMLGEIGIHKSVEELMKSIVKKEVVYGLKTNDYKSVWKLHQCAKGHSLVFDSLAAWIGKGNFLIITKGNHDLEWYWKAVRDYLRYLLAEHAGKMQEEEPLCILQNNIIPSLSFVDNQLLIDQKILVEHGHRYQKITAVQGAAVLKNDVELNLPFGSFFNRYLINRLELAFPYFDNIRPSENLLPVLIRERFPLAIQLLFRYIPFILLIIPKKLYWETFKRLVSFLFIIIIPVLITVYAIWKSLHVNMNLFGSSSSLIVKQIYSVLFNLAFLFLSYLFGRIMVMVKLSGSDSLYPNAQDVFKAYPDIRIVTFGHTHNPEQLRDDDRLYFNTGTWIPVYETSAADVRLDRTYTYLHIRHEADGKIIPEDLMRWNDDACRPDPLILRDKV